MDLIRIHQGQVRGLFLINVPSGPGAADAEHFPVQPAGHGRGDRKFPCLIQLQLGIPALAHIHRIGRQIPDGSQVSPPDDHGIELVSVGIEQDSLQKRFVQLFRVIKSIDFLFHGSFLPMVIKRCARNAEKLMALYHLSAEKGKNTGFWLATGRGSILSYQYEMVRVKGNGNDQDGFMGCGRNAAGFFHC